MVASAMADLPLGAQEQYLREVKWTAPMAAAEEANLLACIFNQGNHCERTVTSARGRLIAGYQPLIVSIARRYASRARVLTFLDLVQEGNVGLLEALTHYPRTARDIPFRLWASAAMRRAMLTALRCESVTYIPVHKLKQLRRLGSEQARLCTELGREPTEQEVAAALGQSLVATRELMALAAQYTVSLDALADRNDEVEPLEGLIVEPLSASASPREDYVAYLVAHLPERERQVITLAYGFADGESRANNEVAALLGISAARVEELHRQARYKLRKALDLFSPKQNQQATVEQVLQA